MENNIGVQNQPELIAKIPEVPEKKNFHWVTILAVAVFVLMSLGVTAFFYYQNQQLKRMIVSCQQAQVSPYPTPTPDPTADWKTYTSNKYSYQIRYPQVSSIVPEGDFKIHIQGKEYPLGTYVAIEILNNQNNLSLEKLGNEKYATDAPTPYDLGWKQAVFMEMDALTTKYSPPGDSGTMTIYLIKKNNVVFSLWKSPIDEPGSNYFDNLSNQVLSTFKFLGEEDKVVGIQTTVCCSCPTKISPSLVGTDGWVIYEEGKNYSEGRPVNCQGTVCAPCPPLE